MAIPSQTMTVEEFDQWIFRPENVTKSFEYIGEAIIEVVSNNYSSQIAFEVGFYIKLHLKQKKIKGYVTGADGGYQVKHERYIPDVGYISGERQSEPCRVAYNPNYPDLAVEVVSPTDNDRDITIKVANYVAAGTVVWLIYPEQKQLNVIVPGQAVEQLSLDDTLNGSPIFEDFKLKVSEIFPEE